MPAAAGPTPPLPPHPPIPSLTQSQQPTPEAHKVGEAVGASGTAAGQEVTLKGGGALEGLHWFGLGFRGMGNGEGSGARGGWVCASAMQRGQQVALKGGVLEGLRKWVWVSIMGECRDVGVGGAGSAFGESAFVSWACIIRHVLVDTRHVRATHARPGTTSAHLLQAADGPGQLAARGLPPGRLDLGQQHVQAPADGQRPPAPSTDVGV